ncbi:hypothetical protein D3C71_1902040 [compost metagenome]
MTTINVKAAPGLRVPREDNGRKYITENDTFPVNQTAYYLRCLANGDLVRVDPTASVDVPAPAAAASKRTPSTPKGA